ncbi:MAG: Dihydrolipoyl dehydrogenase [Stenotrophomonas maltophilia]|nr:MAG: Dihydrolipoyl dehydrogenase [Stenotrophomonas maltophilia]
MSPIPASSTTLLIIGGGPGGYVAAIRAGQLGIPTVLVEGSALGGTCLNVGCIPSKALIHAADAFAQACAFTGESALGIQVHAPRIDLARTQTWKNGIVDRLTSGVAALLKKQGVEVIEGWARIVDGKSVDVELAGGGQRRVHCEHLLLASGSQSVELPDLPLGGPVLSSTEALALDEVPRRLAVIGGGYIGLELGTAYRKLGAEVSIVEAQPRILPSYDAELTKPVATALKRLGVQLLTGHSVLGRDEQGLRLRDDNGVEQHLAVEHILVAVGRRPRSQGWNLESLGLDMQRQAVRVDERCQTSMRNVWAIGDLTGEPMLAHRAMAQGEMVAELVAGQRRAFTPAAIPAVCFTDPEVVVVGLSPEQAESTGVDAISASFPFAANGRAMTLESNDGFVRVVARRDNHLILGWQAVGKAVSELSTAFVQSIEMGACLEDIAGTLHAHPTPGQAVQEAAPRAPGPALPI